MSLYDSISQALTIVQKLGNVDLQIQLLDLGKQALEMHAEIADLRAENAELKNKRDIGEKLIRHEEAYITKSDDKPSLCYCAPCWDVNGLLVQLFCDKDDGSFICPHCKMRGIYDLGKYNAKYREEPDDSENDSYFGW